jgi:predicted phosphoribosyltransferase
MSDATQLRRRGGFADRSEAGRILAGHLDRYAGRTDVVVLALPRGGVPVAFEVARALAAPLDVFVVRKLGLPGHPEFAIGAIATGGVRVLNDDAIQALGVSLAVIDAVTRTEAAELRRREEAYRGSLGATAITGQTAILVDDGLATGSTMQAAAVAVRRMQASRIVVAVPVGAAEACERLRAVVDEVVCPFTPVPFTAVGRWYGDFSETTDADVRHLLALTAPGVVPAAKRA